MLDEFDPTLCFTLQDFERGFICAEVMTYSDLKELGTETAVKAAGKYRQQVGSVGAEGLVKNMCYTTI